MKKLFLYFKNTVISGILLFLPIYVVISIFNKLYSSLYNKGYKLTEILGLDYAQEKKWVPFVTLFLVVLIFFICGLLVRFAMVTKVKEWIEINVLNYIPNYSKFKAKALTKFKPDKKNNSTLGEPAFIEFNNAWKPGFLISTENDKSTVFLPTTPDIDYGEVWVVASNKVTLIDMTLKEFKTSLLLSGKGMKLGKLAKNKI